MSRNVRKTGSISLLLLAAVTLVSRTEAQTPTAVMYGSGHEACSDWLAAEKAPDPAVNMVQRFWVAGLMSGYNAFVSPPGVDIGKGLAPADMKNWMHDQCAASPSETIGQAGLAWIAYLKDRQGLGK